MEINKSLYIDKEAISTLSLAKQGLLNPITGLMSSKEAEEVDLNHTYNGKTFPFSFILAPSGKRNEEVLKNVKVGETLNFINNNKKYGEIIVDEVFKINPIKRVKKIFGFSDVNHLGVSDILNRLGNYAVAGKYTLNFKDIEKIKNIINNVKKEINAKHSTAIMLAGKPFHRAHERLIRLALDRTDLVILFLLKPYKQDYINYNLRYKTVKYFIDNYLPKNKVVLVPLETTYIFAGHNELILDAIVTQNFGCDRLVIGQNHAGLEMYYDKNSIKSIFDSLKGIDIEIDIVSEFVYCNLCKTLVSLNTCPHGSHHHIKYHSSSILELFKLGILPPAVLVRKDISAIILSQLFPNRFKNLTKLYDDILPSLGLLEEHTEEDFYLKLTDLYQTSSLS